MVCQPECGQITFRSPPALSGVYCWHFEIPAMRKLIQLFTILAAASAPAADAIIFNQQYLPGNTYHQTVTMEQDMDMDLGASRMQRNTNTAMGFSAVVAPQQEGVRTKRVTVQYDRTVMGMSDGQNKFSFDSQSPGAANAGPLAAIGLIIGHEFNVVFDEMENVTDVENIEKTLQILAGNDRSSSQIYKQIFNREAVKRMMQQSALRSPRGIVMKPGDSWPFSNDLLLPGIGKLVIRGNYIFKQMVEHKGVQCAEVTAKADINVDLQAMDKADEKNLALMQQMNLKVQEGKMDGTIFYDSAIQFPREIKMTQSILLSAKIPNGPKGEIRLPMKQTIGMTLDSFGPTKAKAPEQKPVPEE